MWGYQYTSPSPEELAVRRQQLNAAGRAGLLPFLLLLPLLLVRLLRKHLPQPRRGSQRHPPDPLQIHLRRLTWILNSTPTHLPEFGPLYILLLGLVHLTYLLFLAFHNTKDDYMHLTKALGHVAISQLPLQYLLAFKSHDSPLRFATGLTHERLNAYHRLLGRIVHVLLAGHATMYLKFFIDKDLLAKRIRDWDVRLGVMAFWSFNFLGLLALPAVRKKAYHAIFYRSHVLLTAVVPVVLWLHVPYTRAYVGLAALFWLSNGLMRWSRTAGVEIAAVVEVGDGLLRVDLRPGNSRLLQSWVPGQHVYLRTSGSVAAVERKNPFTIVEVGPAGDRVALVVRKLAGTTAFLPTLQDAVPSSATCRLEGPYGEASEYLPGLLSAGKHAGQILLVAGGVGATYTLPIYLALLRARGDTSNVKMLWFVKKAEDAVWGADLLRRAGQTVDVDVYVTQSMSQARQSALEDLKGVTIHHVGKRPEIADVLEPLLAAKDESSERSLVGVSGKRQTQPIKRNYSPLTVMVCGPPGLSASLRRVVGKHVLGYGRDVRWYEEQFGFGGS